MKETVLKQDERINTLTSVIEANQLRNNMLLTELLDNGIRNLDANRKVQFENVVREQEELTVTDLVSIETLKLLVRVHLELRNYERVIDVQRKIVAKERNSQNYYDLIRIYHRLGMFNDSQDAAKEMLRIDPNNATAYYVIGAVSGMLGLATMDSRARRMHDDEALRCFRIAGELDSKYVLAKIGEALILVKRNLTAEALKIIKNVEEMSDVLADRDYHGLACFYVAAGMPELALNNLEATFENASHSRRAELLETVQVDPDLDPLKSNEESENHSEIY